MQTITLHDKALAHLSRYSHIRYDIEFGAPFEITQDGIAMALGITRSHASVVLKRLADRNEIQIGEATIKKANSAKKRKIYFITELGKNYYRHRQEELSSDGTCIEELRIVIDQVSFEDIRKVAGQMLD